jgi:hypothetical protein
VLSSVDNIEARDWESFRNGVSRNLSIVLPKRNALGGGTGLGGGEGDLIGSKRQNGESSWTAEKDSFKSLQGDARGYKTSLWRPECPSRRHRIRRLYGKTH